MIGSLFAVVCLFLTHTGENRPWAEIRIHLTNLLPHPFSLHSMMHPLTTSPQAYYCGLSADLSLSASVQFSSVQSSSVAQSCLTLCDPIDCSMPGFPVHHQLLDPTQTHVHRVSDTTISSSVVPFSSHVQSFPASGTFRISQFFTSGGQRFGISASASVLPMNIQDWFPLEYWLDLLAVQGTLI